MSDAQGELDEDFVDFVGGEDELEDYLDIELEEDDYVDEA